MLFINNWSYQLAAACASTALSLSVDDAAAARLVGLGSGEHYLLTLAAVDAAGSETAWEIVKVTAVAGGALTIERAQEGTAARDWPAGSLIECRLTAATLATAVGAAAALTTHEGAADPHTQYVQKVAGKGLSTNDYTTEEKTKLAGLENSHFKGVFLDLTALTAGVTAPITGDYADVDGGIGADVTRYIWDATDAAWKVQGGGTTLTAAQVKELLESNSDTNTVTDAEKTALAGIGGASVDPIVVVAQSSSPYLKRFRLSNLYTLTDVTDLPGANGYEAAFSNSGSLLAFGSISTPRLKVYNTVDWTAQPAPASPPAGGVAGLAFTPNDSKLAVIADYPPYLKLYNIADWSAVTISSNLTARPLCLAMQPVSGDRIAVGMMSSPYLEIRRTGDGAALGTVTSPPASQVYSVAYSPDAKFLAVGLVNTAAKRLLIYNGLASPLTPAATPAETPAGTVNALLFSKDGGRLFVGTDTAPYLYVYDTETWEQLPAPDSPPSASVTSLALSADGRKLIVAMYTNGLRAYDTDTMAYLRSGYVSGNAYAVVVSPDLPATADYLDQLNERLSLSVLRTQRAALDAERNTGFIIAMLESSNLIYGSDFDVDASQFTGTWALTTAWAAAGNTQSLGSTNTTDSSSSTATLTQTLAKPSWVKFDWKVDSEAGYDTLSVKIDGTEVLNQSGSLSGSFGPYEVPAGSFTLEATYNKDSSGLSGTDKAFIDNVKIIGQP